MRRRRDLVAARAGSARRGAMTAPATNAAAGVAKTRRQRDTTSQTRMTIAAEARRLDDGLDRREAQAEQHAGQHRVGERRRNRRHRPSERLDQAPPRSAAPAAMRKAPTAAGKPPATAPVEASSAAPGVDHAAETGCRGPTLSAMPASAHRDGGGHEARSRLGVVRARRRETVQDDGERTPKADKGGHASGQHRLQLGSPRHPFSFRKRRAKRKAAPA